MEHAWQSFYGAATVGERGQVVIPQAARETLGIKPGDKLLVLGGPLGDQGIVMIKAEAVSAMLAKFSSRMSDLEKILTESVEREKDEED